MNRSLIKTLGMFLGALVIIAFLVFSVSKGSKGGLGKEDVEKVVAEYIQKNPKLILESVSQYQQQAMADQEKNAQKNVKEKLSDIENDPSSPVGGNPKGDVVVTEFFDYSCGYCKKVSPSIVQLINEDKNVKIVFKELPILGPNSELASRAALAVNMISPEKYFDFHNKLMDSRAGGQEAIDAIATGLGIDVKVMQEKMKSADVETTISKNKDLASQIGIHGTPAFVIGGELVPGAVDYNTLKGMVEKTRSQKK